MNAKLINGNTLAFIGDAVFSLQVREFFVSKGIQKSNVLQRKTVELVSAKGQAKILKTLLDENLLSEEELEIVKRGRNTKSHSVAKNADILTYRNATGFEALWGFLYLDNRYDRLKELSMIIFEMEG